MRNFITKINDTAPANSGILDAGEDNVRFEELENAVTAGGITLDGSTGPDTATDMLAESMSRHASGALWCTDTGAANAYIAGMTGSFVAPKTLFDGLTIRMKPGNANTGASTLNAFGLGSKPIVDHVQAALVSGVLDGRVAEFIYRPSIGAGSWQVPAWSNALYVGQTPSSPPAVSSGEGWLVNGSNQGDLNFPGLNNDSTPLADDIFAFHDDADSEHKGITYAQLQALLGSGGGILGIQFLTASGTYTKTTNTTKGIIFATGGGGGGAGCQTNRTAGGGGAGATVIHFADLSAGPTFAFTIGAGGTPGVAGGGQGGNGGTTTFDSIVSAGGGLGGYGGESNLNSPGGKGGVPTIGLIQMNGSPGDGAGYENGGTGGASWWGGAGQAGHNLTTSAGAEDHPAGWDALGYGSGGGGADGDASAGGAGKAGCIMVVEFA